MFNFIDYYSIYVCVFRLQMKQKHTNYVPVKAQKSWWWTDKGWRDLSGLQNYPGCKGISVFDVFEVFDAKEAFEVIRFCFYISDFTSNDL